MNRRILALILALCMMVTAAGCGKDPSLQNQGGNFGITMNTEEETPQEALPAEPVSSGNFSLPYNLTLGWDPYNCTGMENQAVMDLIYEGLFTTTPDYWYEPVLCESFEVSDSGYTYTFTLRDAKFSNGRTVTSDDVIYSMEKAEGSVMYARRFDDVAHYYVTDPKTVVVELYYANELLPSLLSFPIIPYGTMPQNAPGTGPFMKSGNSMLVQNGNWWQGSGNLKIETVTLFASQSAEDTRDNFEIDNVHMVYNDPTASTAATFHGDYELWNSTTATMQYIGFNYQEGLFQYEEMRREITNAIDRSRITETVYHNFADAASLPVSPYSDMYFEDLAERYDYTSPEEVRGELMKTEELFWLPADWLPPDEAEAKRKAEEAAAAAAAEEAELAGIIEEEPEEENADEESTTENSEEDTTPKYNRIVLLVQGGNLSREAAAKIVAENLADAGFTVETVVREGSEYYYHLNHEEWHLYYGEINLKPDFDLREILLQEGDYSYGGIWEDRELRNLFTDAMENSGNRYDLYEYIMEQGYLVPVLFVNNAVFTTRGVFTGLNPSPDNLFYNITEVEVHHN